MTGGDSKRAERNRKKAMSYFGHLSLDPAGLQGRHGFLCCRRTVKVHKSISCQRHKLMTSPSSRYERSLFWRWRTFWACCRCFPVHLMLGYMLTASRCARVVHLTAIQQE